MEVSLHRILSVEAIGTDGAARRAGIDLAERLGFTEADVGRVALVVTEASTNLVKHTRGGEVMLSILTAGPVKGIGVLALDRGPGIANLARALDDGVSSRGTAGNGLGAIRRLASEFDIHSTPHGTALFAGLFPTAPPAPPREPLAMGAVCVPRPGEEVCGDAVAVVQTDERCTVMVADGLGHGAGAADASHAAVRVFRANAAAAPAEIVERVHDGLRATRGAAASVAAIDLRTRVLRFAGVGNVGGAIVAGSSLRSMVCHHGTLGHEARRFQEFAYPWPEGALFVLHSDGLGSRWMLDRYPGISQRHPMLAAGTLYRDFRREADDSTVVVLRDAR